MEFAEDWRSKRRLKKKGAAKWRLQKTGEMKGG